MPRVAGSSPPQAAEVQPREVPERCGTDFDGKSLAAIRVASGAPLSPVSCPYGAECGNMVVAEWLWTMALIVMFLGLAVL